MTAAHDRRPMIIVEETGPLALVEDLGRTGWTHVGVPPAGAADRQALRTANRLVGNPEEFAAVEITLGGLRVLAVDPLWCVVTGPATTLTLIAGDGPRRSEPSHQPLHLAAGDQLTIEPPPYGLRNYLAVRGGLDVPAVLGSRSTDLLSGLGPAPLRPGDRLGVGQTPLPFPAVDVCPPPAPPAVPAVLELEPGPRQDWFTDAALAALVEQPWRVGADSDRTAVRLEGAPLARRVTDELPSEGVIRGAVQVPPSGLPLIFGSNHPVTGGYPVIAVATASACDRAAQLRPGDTLRFRWRGTLRLP